MSGWLIFSLPVFAEYRRTKYLNINSGSKSTTSRYVTLSIGRPFRATEMRIANDMQSLSAAIWVPYKSRASWTLPFNHGTRTVYVQFRKDDRQSLIYDDTIEFRQKTEKEQDKKYIVINGDKKTTKYLDVDLRITIPPGFTRMRVANKQEDLLRLGWRAPKRSLDWNLAWDGGSKKTVYVQFQDQFGVDGPVYSDSIELNVTSNVDLSFNINEGAPKTNNRAVYLTFNEPGGVVGVRVSNKNNFDGLEYLPIQQYIPWVLSEKSGTKNVYVQFQDYRGREKTIRSQIIYEEPESHVGSGTLLKSPSSHIYFLANDGKVHPFLSPAVYHSWYRSYSKVKYISDAKLSDYPVGEPMCARPGSWLLKFGSDPKIYAIEAACQLRPLFSEVEAFLIYGESWRERILELTPSERVFYKIISSSVHKEVDGVVDLDHDGVDDELERNYGSSPSKVDSDGDKLSDYEEIYVWLTDPTSNDTDGDGLTDAEEVLSGSLPTGPRGFVMLPEHAIDYPVGSLVNGVNVSTRIEGVRKQFIIFPPFKLSPTVKETVQSSNIANPMKEYGGILLRL